MLDKIRNLISDPQLEIREEVQSLWSDFGSLLRCFSPKLAKTIIVKFVSAPELEQTKHPRGWNTLTSHNRKLKSYQVETNFYQTYSSKVDQLCQVPNLIAANSEANQTILIMEDLSQLGFSEKRESGNLYIVKQCINWLSHFHACFMLDSAETLWQQGGYWHLSTRQDELNIMPSSRLKSYASQIDRKLQDAQFQTLIHGDAKLQNMCFKPETAEVAAIDFQYVGKGAGIVDFMYLLSSAFEEQELRTHHQELLEYYLTSLKSALQHYQKQVAFEELEREYRYLYQFAWADFYRFLLGWNPSSWKINSFIEEMSDIAIERFKENN